MLEYPAIMKVTKLASSLLSKAMLTKNKPISKACEKELSFVHMQAKLQSMCTLR